MTKHKSGNLWRVLPWLLLAWWMVQQYSPTLLSPGADLRVIVHESQAPLKAHVFQARRLADERGIELRIVDQDAETGTGSTPKEVAAAIEAGKQVGLPALVCMRGERVVKAERLPDTAEGILK